jgi:hypothetical protein
LRRSYFGLGFRQNSLLIALRPKKARKSSLQWDGLEINEAIREVIALTHGEVVKNGIHYRAIREGVAAR